jgi:hypothetical protein
MSVGQIGSSARGAGASGAGFGNTPGVARNDAPVRPVRTADVNVTLTPAAREHLSRMEGFAATIGTQKQPKAMAKPGISVDLKV